MPELGTHSDEPEPQPPIYIGDKLVEIKETKITKTGTHVEIHLVLDNQEYSLILVTKDEALSEKEKTSENYVLVSEMDSFDKDDVYSFLQNINRYVFQTKIVPITASSQDQD